MVEAPLQSLRACVVGRPPSHYSTYSACQCSSTAAPAVLQSCRACLSAHCDHSNRLAGGLSLDDNVQKLRLVLGASMQLRHGG